MLLSLCRSLRQVDCRTPILSFPAPLYEFATGKGIPVIVALNKADLLPPGLADGAPAQPSSSCHGGCHGGCYGCWDRTVRRTPHIPPCFSAEWAKYLVERFGKLAAVVPFYADPGAAPKGGLKVLSDKDPQTQALMRCLLVLVAHGTLSSEVVTCLQYSHSTADKASHVAASRAAPPAAPPPFQAKERQSGFNRWTRGTEEVSTSVARLLGTLKAQPVSRLGPGVALGDLFDKDWSADTAHSHHVTTGGQDEVCLLDLRTRLS